MILNSSCNIQQSVKGPQPERKSLPKKKRLARVQVGLNKDHQSKLPSNEKAIELCSLRMEKEEKGVIRRGVNLEIPVCSMLLCFTF